MDFVKKIVFFTAIVNLHYEYDKVYFTECCNHAVHKNCWNEYTIQKQCNFCNIQKDESKPDYQLELTLHDTFNRMKIKDSSSVPRNIWFPKFPNSLNKPQELKF